MIILGSANERRLSCVTPYLIGRAHTQNEPSCEWYFALKNCNQKINLQLFVAELDTIDTKRTAECDTDNDVSNDRIAFVK